MFNIFDGVAERICSNCINGNDMCATDTNDCPFSVDFAILAEECANAQKLAEALYCSAQKDYWTDAFYFHE